MIYSCSPSRPNYFLYHLSKRSISLLHSGPGSHRSRARLQEPAPTKDESKRRRRRSSTLGLSSGKFAVHSGEECLPGSLATALFLPSLGRRNSRIRCCVSKRTCALALLCAKNCLGHLFLLLSLLLLSWFPPKDNYYLNVFTPFLAKAVGRTQVVEKGFTF